MGNISLWQLLIVLALVVLLFGTKKLRSLGSDLGSAVKGFKKAVNDKDADFEEPKSVENKTAESTDKTEQTQQTEQKDKV